MFTTILLARILGASSFGLYGLVVSTSSSAYGMVRLGVDAGIHVSVAENAGEKTQDRVLEEILGAGLSVLLLSGIIAGLGCFLAADWLATRIYGTPEVAKWIRVGGVGAMLQCLFQFIYVTLAGLHRFTEYAAVVVATSALSAAVLPAAAWLSGLEAAVVALIVIQILSIILLGWVAVDVLRSQGIKISLRNWRYRVANLLALGLPFYASGLVAVPIGYYLQGMLVQHGGTEALGYFRIILSLIAIVSFAPQSASAAMVSMFTHARVGDKPNFAQQVAQNVKFVAVFAFLVATGLIATLPLVVWILLGDTYIGVVGPASIGLLTAVLMTAVGVATNALFSSRQVKLIFVITAIQSLTYLAAGATLVPSLGLTGLLTAELIGSAAALAFLIAGSRRWRKANSIDLTWFGIMLLPVPVVLAYVRWQLFGYSNPSPGGLVLGGSLLLLCWLWVFFVVLTAGERQSLKRLVADKIATVWMHSR